jgi:DNA-binding transcriptional regulator YiaG
MKTNRFDRLAASLGEVRAHVTAECFAGRISNVEIKAEQIRAVRKRSSMTQRRFAVMLSREGTELRSMKKR